MLPQALQIIRAEDPYKGPPPPQSPQLETLLKTIKILHCLKAPKLWELQLWSLPCPKGLNVVPIWVLWGLCISIWLHGPLGMGNAGFLNPKP